MKAACFISLIVLLCAGRLSAQVNNEALLKLTAKIGKTFWSPPEKRLVRATTYRMGAGSSDSYSAKGKSDEKITLRYATEKEAGTLAVPHWLPRGSMVKIHTLDGLFSYIAADQGTDVENKKAAEKLGRTIKEKAAPVLDFCAPKRLASDFVIVEIYYYAGKVPFSDLSPNEQKTLFAYAMEYVAKHE